MTNQTGTHVAGLAALTLAAGPDHVQLSSAGLRELIVAGADRAISGSDAVDRCVA